MNKYLMLASILLLTACASTPTKIGEAEPAQLDDIYAHNQRTIEHTVPVHVTRDRDANSALCGAHIQIDMQEVGNIGTGKTATFWVAPGQHQIAASNNIPILCRVQRHNYQFTARTDQPVHIRIATYNGQFSVGRAAK